MLKHTSIYDRNFPRMSSSLNRKYSSLSSFTLVPPYSGRSTLSPAATFIGMSWPSLFFNPGPVATTVASKTLPTFASGITIPPFVFQSWPSSNDSGFQNLANVCLRNNDSTFCFELRCETANQNSVEHGHEAFEC